ncbi:HAMP domain-containing sensor histidine kinase [Dehalococcoides sp. THU3]|uniref:sensor histidine kinase n=1 Tax=Dehalococcoides TaxID=61434 RepID=UPI0005B575D8|nr:MULTISPECIES: HAMP domain-containing sensor histidine kinase [Dehalococcoides]QYY57807.1 HAMP domain-containing histidine kinase [Dehalococcoides mccartyi]BAQ34954.1 two-component sensor histidine kinase [Dehalococcoides sp. UCH007]
MSVKAKLTVIYSLVLLIVLWFFGFTSYFLLSYDLFSNLDSSLAGEAEKAKGLIIQGSDNNLYYAGSVSADLVYVYDIETGNVFGSEVYESTVLASVSDICATSGDIPCMLLETSDPEIRLYVTRYEHVSEANLLLVYVGDASYIYRTLDEYKHVLYMTIPFALIIAAVFGYFVAHRSFRQVKVIAQTTDSINPANLKDRIPVKQNDELGQLSSTLNSLFDRVYGFIQSQHRFTSDASHDLKAPLTVIRAESELALRKERNSEEYRQAFKNIVKQVERMTLIIDDLMTLASLDAGPRPSHSSKIDLGAALESSADKWQTAMQIKKIKSVRQIQHGLSIYGEAEQFNRLFDNLLSNAVKYTPSGGEVSISLKEEDGFIVVSVQDSGIGISKEHLPHIFDRFYRGDWDIEGTGLGLSIVKGTSELYKGRVEVISEQGKGSEFKVFLPQSAS